MMPPTSVTDLVVYDGSFISGAFVASSKATNLAVTDGEPTIAVGVTVFGLGLLTLPLMSRLDGIVGTDELGAVAYERRLRRLDVTFISRELAMSSWQLNEHITACPPDSLRDEVKCFRAGLLKRRSG